MPAELGDPALSPADDIDEWLAYGFQGVGELFVHGRTDQDTREDGTVITAKDNWDQLIDLLEQFAAPQEVTDRPLKLILAHCGDGPADHEVIDPNDGGMTEEDRDAWLDRLDTLLETYPYVWFDLAGMQVGDPGVDETSAVQRLFTSAGPTKVGSALLERIARYPDRFLLGTDTSDEYATTTSVTDSTGTKTYLGTDSYLASISNYIAFLDLALSAPDKARVMTENAAEVLWDPVWWIPEGSW